MKKFTINLMVLIFAFLANDAVAKVIRVDNNEGASADYVKLQDAINNAEAGDTVYVVGSPNWYDADNNNRAVEIRLNKQLTIIGPGFYLGENENTQANKQTAKIYRINIGEGANSANIIGMNLNPDQSSFMDINSERFDGSRGTEGPKNLTIRRCIIDEIYINDANNTLVTQNYISSSTNPVYIDGNASNTVIRNNIIRSGSRFATIYGDNASLSNTVIENNVLSTSLARINGTTIQNNIFIGGGFNDCDNNNIKNNLFTTTQDAVIQETSGGNSLVENIFSAVQANIFVVPSPEVDNEFRLASDSPAVGQGVNGEDLGAFGGIAPYRLSGQPSIPAIYDLSTTGVGTPSNGMQVQIKVKANN